MLLFADIGCRGRRVLGVVRGCGISPGALVFLPESAGPTLEGRPSGVDGLRMIPASWRSYTPTYVSLCLLAIDRFLTFAYGVGPAAGLSCPAREGFGVGRVRMAGEESSSSTSWLNPARSVSSATLFAIVASLKGG